MLRNSKSDCLKYKFSIIDWIGIYSSLVFWGFVLLGPLLLGYIIVPSIVLLLIFFLFNKRRWIRYFCIDYFEVFHIRKYRDKISYSRIIKIAFEEPPFAEGLLQVFYMDVFGKTIRAQFEQHNSIYLCTVLNFIKDKIPENTIDENTLILANIVKEGENYKYLPGIARKYRQGKL
jgi:hypothetical protein